MKEPLFTSPGESLCAQYLTALGNMGAGSGLFYLWLGRAWAFPSSSLKVKLGEPKLCYRNAFVLAEQHKELVYCEGYACPAGLIPVHHAWCVDKKGEVLEPTWKDRDAEYFGVALNLNFARSIIRETGVWGVLGEMLPRKLLACDPLEFLHGDWIPEEASLDKWRQFLKDKAKPSSL